jgi:hypothetical protein
MKIYEFNEALIQHYTNPRAPNVIILLLIADTPKDLCVKNFIKEINSIKKEYENIFIVTYPKVSSSNFGDLTVGSKNFSTRTRTLSVKVSRSEPDGLYPLLTEYIYFAFCFSSRIIFSIIYRQQSSKWFDELLNKIEDTQNKQSIQFSPSTILALYIRRKFFVSYRSIYSNNNNQSNSILTFSDWIDLLFNGNFREPISITEWPMKFH